MTTQIIKEVLAHNFITNFTEVTREIANLTEEQLTKGFNGFQNAYNDLPNLFDIGDIDSVLYFVNKTTNEEVKTITKQDALQIVESFRSQQSSNNKTSDIILLAMKILEIYEEDKTLTEESFNYIVSEAKNEIETI